MHTWNDNNNINNIVDRRRNERNIKWFVQRSNWIDVYCARCCWNDSVDPERKENKRIFYMRKASMDRHIYTIVAVYANIVGQLEIFAIICYGAWNDFFCLFLFCQCLMHRNCHDSCECEVKCCKFRCESLPGQVTLDSCRLYMCIYARAGANHHTIILHHRPNPKSFYSDDKLK